MPDRPPASDVRAPSGADVGARRPRAEALRCNAPQRQPKAPDTAWGRLRAARGWSLRDLERETWINAGVLSRIERGIGGPHPDQARRLLAVFDGAR